MWFMIIVLFLLLALVWNLLLPLVIRGILSWIFIIFLAVIFVKAIIAFCKWLGEMSPGNIIRTLLSIFAVLAMAAALLFVPIIIGRMLYF